MDDAFALQRFITAQDPVIDAVLAELSAGAKRTHWMWFVFPQLAGLGRSETARFYGIGSRAEAQAYWHHPVLGARLATCCERLRPHVSRGAERIFGPTDAIKLRSCLTLFEQVAPEQPLFGELLDGFYAGARDSSTLALLER